MLGLMMNPNEAWHAMCTQRSWAEARYHARRKQVRWYNLKSQTFKHLSPAGWNGTRFDMLYFYSSPSVVASFDVKVEPSYSGTIEPDCDRVRVLVVTFGQFTKQAILYREVIVLGWREEKRTFVGYPCKGRY